MNNDSAPERLLAELRRRAAVLDPGDRLPSSRDLVREHHVSPATVATAVAGLVAEGLAYADPGHGTFVAQRRAPRGEPAWQDGVFPDDGLDASPMHALGIEDDAPIVLNAGYVSVDLQPTAALRSAGARALRRPDAWTKAPIAGLAELRSLFATPLGLEPRDAIVVPGTQSGLASIIRAVAGDVVLVEEPTYPGATVAIRAAGRVPWPVATDESGLIPQALDDAFGQTGSRLVFTQPCVANPTGATLGAARRSQILQILRDRGGFLIEDDWARDLVIDGHPPRPLAATDSEGHVIYLRSLTKSAAPSLRLGAILARGSAYHRILAHRAADDYFVARLMQEVAVEVLSSPAWRRHLTALHGGLRQRRSALTLALDEHAPGLRMDSLPIGGLHLWVRLPAGLRSDQVVEAMRLRGVRVGDGSAFWTQRDRFDHLRLSFSSADEESIVRGVRLLGREVAAAT